MQATIPLNSTQSAVTSFCPTEIRGLVAGGCGAASQSPTDATTTIDGPRPASDVNDGWAIRTDRFGAAAIVTDPIGNSTRLYRGNRTFPGLVTRVVHKNGWANDAFYDTPESSVSKYRGHDVSVYGGARAAFTLGVLSVDGEYRLERWLNYLFQNTSISWATRDQAVNVINHSFQLRVSVRS